MKCSSCGELRHKIISCKSCRIPLCTKCFRLNNGFCKDCSVKTINKEYFKKAGEVSSIVVNILVLFLAGVLFSSPAFADDCFEFNSDDARFQVDVGSGEHIDWLIAGLNGGSKVRGFVKFQGLHDNCSITTVTSCILGIHYQGEYGDVEYTHLFYESAVNWSNTNLGGLSFTPACTSNVGSDSFNADSGWYNITLPNDICQNWLDDGGANNMGLVYMSSGENESSGDHEILWDGMNQGILEQPQLFVSGTIAPPSSSAMNLTIYDTDFSKNVTNVIEDVAYFGGANVTYGGVVDSGETCSWSGTNMSAVFRNVSVSNVTLATSSDSVKIHLGEGNTSRVNDYTYFAVCELDLGVDVQITFNGTTVKTVDKQDIPKCSNGVHYEYFEYGYNTSSADIGVSCSACDGGQYQIRVISLDNEVLRVFREFTIHSEPLSFNASTQTYDYLDYPYAFLDSEIAGNVTISCTNITTNYQFDVIRANLTIEVSSINDDAYTDGMVLESSNSTLITASFKGDVYSNITFTVYNSSWTAMKQATTEFILLNLSDLVRDGTYYINITALDDNSNRFNGSGYFVFNDTTFPTISFTNPLSDNSTEVLNTSTMYLTGSINDLQLFAYELTVFYPNLTTFYTASLENINETTYSFNETINPTVEGTYTVMVTATDYHTATTLKDLPYVKDYADVKFNDNVFINYSGEHIAYSVTPIKAVDRYSLNYEFGVLGKEPITHKFLVSCEGIVYIRNSEYPANFVCPKDLLWIDFDSDQLISYTVKYVKADVFEVSAFMFPVSELTFNSVGGVNVYSENVTFLSESVVIPSYADPYNTSLINSTKWFSSRVNLDSNTGIFAYLLLIIIVVGLIVLCEVLRIPAFMIIIGFMMFFVAFLIFTSISAIIGAVVFLVGIMYIIRGVAIAV